jgi:hypothetical protein
VPRQRVDRLLSKRGVDFRRETNHRTRSEPRNVGPVVCAPWLRCGVSCDSFHRLAWRQTHAPQATTRRLFSPSRRKSEDAHRWTAPVVHAGGRVQHPGGGLLRHRSTGRHHSGALLHGHERILRADPDKVEPSTEHCCGYAVHQCVCTIDAPAFARTCATHATRSISRISFFDGDGGHAAWGRG